MRVTVIATGFDAGDAKTSSKVVSKPVLDGEAKNDESDVVKTVSEEKTSSDDIDIPPVFTRRSNRFNIGL